MIRRVLTWFLVIFVIGLVIYWIVIGGFSNAVKAGEHFTNPLAVLFGNGSTTGSLITLPWQPAPVRGPDISQYVGQADAEQSQADSGGTQQGDVTQSQTNSQTGNPSPYEGQVSIAGNTATQSDPSREYIALQASGANAPVDISGWSLQSAISGFRANIPEAAPVFISGVVNDVTPVSLAPGGTAIITTGTTPVGTSFQENSCSGYLGQLQNFTPPLSMQCPDISRVLPDTPQNEQTYGTSCFDYLNTLPSCSTPSSVPATLTSACKQFIANNLTYNGCVAQFRTDPSFTLPRFRLFLNLRAEAWNNTHDVIRLLDSAGRVVDVLTY